MPQPEDKPEPGSDAWLSEMIAKRRRLAEAVANGEALPKLDRFITTRGVAGKSTDTDSSQQPSADAQTPAGRPAEIPDAPEEDAEWF